VLKVDDMDFVAGAKDIGCHFWVPEARLVAKVHTCFQHFTHGDRHDFLQRLVLKSAQFAGLNLPVKALQTIATPGKTDLRLVLQASRLPRQNCCKTCRIVARQRLFDSYPHTSLQENLGEWRHTQPFFKQTLHRFCFFLDFCQTPCHICRHCHLLLPRLVATCADTHAFLPLHKVQATRQLEQQAAQALPPHTLMQRAGLAVARVALAVAPHARTIWIACGYGNNGGDGLQAAACLQRWGKQVKVSTLAPQQAMPVDAQAAWQEAVAAGVCFVDKPPALHADDLCIDALLGIGAHRAPDAAMQACLAAMRHSPAPVLAVDIPSGLLADTGTWADDASGDMPNDIPSVCADHTVTLLTLKPGLFTAHGRDAAGQIWWHDLDVPTTAHTADARLQGAKPACAQPNTCAARCTRIAVITASATSICQPQG
jgi:hydroxyethylthiazole kinase-like uncharacterized protein yjeF